MSQLFPQWRLLQVPREYLEFVVPGQSAALVDLVRLFLGHQGVVGAFLLITMIFFSSLAFTVLEKAMAVIFFHRVSVRRRHFLVSAIMPYLCTMFLGSGLIIVTMVSGVQWEITRHILGWYYASVSQIRVVYGSLTTSGGIMLSVEFGALVLLLGTQVIAEYERLGREPP